MKQIIEGFERNWDVPQCVGAVDRPYISVLGQKDHHTDYYNRKGWYSIILQGAVDHKYRFLDINVGWPGNVHDATVLSHSLSVDEKAES